MKITLLIPIQKSQYSIMYSIFEDIFITLKNLDIDCIKVYVKVAGAQDKINETGSDLINISDMRRLVESDGEKNNVFLTLDNTCILNELYKLKQKRNILVWAHYFMGHRFIFHRYNEIEKIFKVSFYERLLRAISEYVPNVILRILLRNYIKALQSFSVVSQSLWTDLLLERVYSIKTLGILPIPIEPNAFQLCTNPSGNRLLLFLGNYDETDLQAANSAIRTIMMHLNVESIEYFGTEETGRLFQKYYGIELKYLGKISREELALAYQNHYMTLCPIFNGNFEMVPIESLMCGTPVISFVQPFMEVTGQSTMVANIMNLPEIEEKVTNWKNLSKEVRERERDRILSVMDRKKVCSQLINYVQNVICVGSISEHNNG